MVCVIKHIPVYNWETATYGKIWDNEDVHDLESVETEFPAIVFNDMLTSEAALSCEPTDLALRKIDDMIYSGKKTCVELVRSILKPRQHTLLKELKLENHSEQHIREVPRSNSISHFLYCFIYTTRTLYKLSGGWRIRTPTCHFFYK
ncbi:hypothetical protein Tco_0203983 [Tanacetum coccineum]